jgi:hypothetical protein
MPYLKPPSTLSPVTVQSQVVYVTVWGLPGQGYLEVHVYFRGVEVTATVTIVNAKTGQTVGTYTAPTDFPITLDVGSYICYAYYDRYRATQTVEIVEGQTTIWRVYMEPRICFVATAVYGYGHPALTTFRMFRDKMLLTNFFGRKFVHLYYYVIGRPIANFLKQRETVRKIVKLLLDKFREFLEAINVGEKSLS